MPIFASAKPLNRATTAAVVILLMLFLVVCIKTAWVCDDAFITFRTVDNFINGYGLTWNAGERVETYTHPLWMFLLSGASFLTHDVYLTSIFLSIAISLATVLLFSWKLARSQALAILGLVMLIRSNAFMDYCTSGLENPLTYLLLAIFFVFYLNEKETKPVTLSCIASLGVLNRMDTLLLYAPMLTFSLLKDRKAKTMLAVAAGFLPFLLWKGFSTIYYGFPFPNTAYAKLGTGINNADLFAQGLLYLLHSMRFDPITPLIILFGIYIAFAEKEPRHKLAGVGIILYLIYIVRIGGDFMSGRFLAAPLFCGVILVSRSALLKNKTAFLTTLAAASLIGLLAAAPSFLIGQDGIADERRFYFPNTGLLRSYEGHMQVAPVHELIDQGKSWRQDGASVVTAQFIGMCGYYAGPQVYIIDTDALASSLLARLPASYTPHWRIGHFQRVVPEGYVETIRSGANQLTDKNLASYYEKLSLLTRGPLFSRERLKTIWAMNTGRFDYLIDYEKYRYPDLVKVPLACLDTPDKPLKIPTGGAEIRFPSPVRGDKIEIQMHRPVTVRIEFFSDGERIGHRIIRTKTDEATPETYCLRIPGKAGKNAVDKLRIFPLDWKPPCIIARISFPVIQPQ